MLWTILYIILNTTIWIISNLKNIAPLFGYNSSYLSKIFNKKVGEGFNIFVDKVRIKHSKELLLTTDLKVYEIAEKVGYKMLTISIQNLRNMSK